MIEAETKLTPKQKRKAKADDFYQLNVNLTKSLKSAIREIDDEILEDTLGAYMSLMQPPEEAKETMEVQTEIMQQMALFASQCLTRILTERYRDNRKKNS
jgi:hypothetical protein